MPCYLLKKSKGVRMRIALSSTFCPRKIKYYTIWLNVGWDLVTKILFGILKGNFRHYSTVHKNIWQNIMVKQQTYIYVYVYEYAVCGLTLAHFMATLDWKCGAPIHLFKLFEFIVLDLEDYYIDKKISFRNALMI